MTRKSRDKAGSPPITSSTETFKTPLAQRQPIDHRRHGLDDEALVLAKSALISTINRYRAHERF